MIYSSSISDRLLGALIKNPTLCVDSKYPIDHTNFKIKFQEIVYIVVYNLSLSGCSSISLMDINEWLKPYTAQYNIYLDNQGDDYISTIVDLVDDENFDYYYNDFRKFALLNEYKDNGYDVTKFWDENQSVESQLENLNGYTSNDIIDYFESVQTNIKKKFNVATTEIEETQAGLGFLEFKEKVKETPLYGSSFCSNILNEVTRGMIDGQITCFSSPSGTGKTSIGIATMCKICAKEIWDDTVGDFVENKSQTRNGGLFIQFELSTEELEPKFIANISGVPANIILDGKFTEDEERRIDRANQILIDSNIHLVYMPNFTTKLIDMEIKDHILKYGIDFIVYDYIQEGASLNGELNKANGGIGMRSDQVLLSLCSFLKDEARLYNVPIYTCTQTNANLGANEVLGAESIAGSRAVANKLDIGGILLPLRPKEEKARDIIEQNLKERGFGMPHANYCYHMYKVRFGKYPQNVKIWVYLDLSTGRMQDCFLTDCLNRPIACKGVKLEKN